MQQQIRQDTRDHSLDNLKAFLALGIIVVHSTSCLRYIQTPQIIPLEVYDAFITLVKTLLAAFFFISGYFFSMPAEGDFKTNYFSMLKKRARSLLVPYFMWNSGYVAIFLLGGLFSPAVKGWCETLALHTPWGLLDAVAGVTHHPADGPLWYLRNLFLLAAIYPLIRTAAKKLGILLPIGIFVFLSVINTVFDFPEYVHTHYLMPYSTTLFVLGVVTREKNWSLDFFKKYAIQCFAFGLGAFLIWQFFKVGGAKMEILQGNILYILELPLWMAFSRFTTWGKDTFLYKYFTETAFFIYAGHFFCCSIFLHIAAPFIPQTPYQLILLWICYFGGGAIMMICGYWVLSKLFPRFLKVLTGNR